MYPDDFILTDKLRRMKRNTGNTTRINHHVVNLTSSFSYVDILKREIHMSSNNNPNLIQIHVNENMKKVYDNQSVLQALLQIDESIQHCCHTSRNYHIFGMNSDCAVKNENHDQKRNFKACLAPVEAGMELTTE